MTDLEKKLQASLISYKLQAEILAYVFNLESKIEELTTWEVIYETI